MSKKIVSAIVLLTLIFNIAINTYAINQPDIVGNIYEKEIREVINLGIMKGYEDGNFYPEKNITRSELAKIIVKALGYEDEKITSQFTPFSDVKKEHWASGCINIAYKENLMRGHTIGDFKPEAELTLKEAVTIFLRLLGYDGFEYYKGYMEKAKEIGILENLNVDWIDASVTRSQVSKMLINTIYKNKNGSNDRLVERLRYKYINEIDKVDVLNDIDLVVSLKNKVDIIPDIGEFHVKLNEEILSVQGIYEQPGNVSGKNFLLRLSSSLNGKEGDLSINGISANRLRDAKYNVDFVQPRMDKVEVLNDMQVKVTFSENMKKNGGISDVRNYSISSKVVGKSNPTIQDVIPSTDLMSVIINFNQDKRLEDISVYELNINNIQDSKVQDLNGNLVDSESVRINVVGINPSAPEINLVSSSYNKSEKKIHLLFDQPIDLSNKDDIDLTGIIISNGLYIKNFNNECWISDTTDRSHVVINIKDSDQLDTDDLSSTYITIRNGLFKDIKNNDNKYISTRLMNDTLKLVDVTYSMKSKILKYIFDREIDVRDIDVGSNFGFRLNSLEYYLSEGQRVNSEANTASFLLSSSQQNIIQGFSSNKFGIVKMGAVRDLQGNGIPEKSEAELISVYNSGGPSLQNVTFDQSTSNIILTFDRDIKETGVYASSIKLYHEDVKMATGQVFYVEGNILKIGIPTSSTSSLASSTVDRSKIIIVIESGNGISDLMNNEFLGVDLYSNRYVKYADSVSPYVLRTVDSYYVGDEGTLSKSDSDNKIRIKFNERLDPTTVDPRNFEIFVNNFNHTQLSVLSAELLSDQTTVVIQTCNQEQYAPCEFKVIVHEDVRDLSGNQVDNINNYGYIKSADV